MAVSRIPPQRPVSPSDPPPAAGDAPAPVPDAPSSPVDPAEQEALRGQLEHAEQAFVELNARIARLAVLLGIEMDGRAATIQHILQHGPHELERLQAEGESGNPQALRQAREWEELRGLITLRFGLLARTVETLGLDATRRITALAEDDLDRHGFRHGADGFALLQVLNDDRPDPQPD